MSSSNEGEEGIQITFDRRNAARVERRSPARVERRSPARRMSTQERRPNRGHRSSSRGRPPSIDATEKQPKLRVQSANQPKVQNQDDVLDDYYGGRLTCRPSHPQRPGEYYEYEPQTKPPPGGGRPGKHEYYSKINRPSSRPDVEFELGGGGGPPPPPPGGKLFGYNSDSDSDGDGSKYIASVTSKKGLWRRAATPAGNKRGRPLQLKLSLILSRRGQRYKGSSFLYTQGQWNDAELAGTLRSEYRRLKVRHIGLLQKLTSYKTIQFVYFLQYRAARELGGTYQQQGHWQVTARVPITPSDDAEARSAFMYQLRAPAHLGTRTKWTQALDALLVEGAVVDVEIKETFDSIKIYAALFISVLLSLAVALIYGFTMGGDFSTGFSIASWMITALGFLGAVIAAGEYFGLERPTAAFHTVDDLETGQYLPREMMDRTRFARYSRYR